MLGPAIPFLSPSGVAFLQLLDPTFRLTVSNEPNHVISGVQTFRSGSSNPPFPRPPPANAVLVPAAIKFGPSGQKVGFHLVPLASVAFRCPFANSSNGAGRFALFLVMMKGGPTSCF